MKHLDAVAALLYEPGTVMAGLETSDEDAIVRTRELFPGKPYCLVRHWIWIDLDVSEAVRQDFMRVQMQPVMLYAHEVVHDSLGRFDQGDWVRSTPLVSFSKDCFFQSQNTIYVLLGPGERKRAELKVVGSIN